MLALGHTHFTYDGRGNLATMDAIDGVWRFSYNARNHMVRSQSPSGEVTTYAYDGYGRRIRKTKGETVVEFIWAGEQLIGEVAKTGDTVVRRDYLYLPGTFTPLAMRVAGKVYSYHTDHLGTPRLLTGPDGTVVWAASYSSFGEASISRATVENPLRASGQYFDAESGLHYNRFRYYSPAMGRYLSRDPLGLLAGMNFYRYAANSPINQADPLGLWTWAGVAEAAVTVVAAAAVAVAVIALAPVALPVAMVLAGAAAGAVAGGLNQAFSESSFCLPCILKAAGLGAVAGALGAIPAAAVACFAPVAGLAGVGLAAAANGAGGAIGYVTNYVDGANPDWSWGAFGATIAVDGVVGGAAQYVQGAFSQVDNSLQLGYEEHAITDFGSTAAQGASDNVIDAATKEPPNPSNESSTPDSTDASDSTGAFNWAGGDDWSDEAFA